MIKQIKSSEIKNFLVDNKNVELLDVRTQDEWDSVGNKDSELFYRKLLCLECERLMTVPDNYTEGVSNTQRYKMLGNGWSVDVIKHIFSNAIWT